MFFASRQDALDAIKHFGERQCCYATPEWPGHCDCKYGIVDAGALKSATSEQTGCPELATVYYLIKGLRDEEWDRVLARDGHTPSGLRVVDLAAASAAMKNAAHAVADAREHLRDLIRGPIE